jgi:hypothetical protein
VPSWLDVGLSTLSLWLVLMLLVPKRDGRTIWGRLRATAAGERRYAFAPPELNAWLSGGFWGHLRAEWRRCLELGVVLWLATLRAEYQGQQRRANAHEAWRDSASGWMWEYVYGYLREEEFVQRCRSRGLPLPAQKAHLPSRPTYVMPPLSWLDERSVQTAVRGASKPREDFTADLFAGEDLSGQLRVRTLGGFQVLTPGGRDIAPELLRRPVVDYIWQYLLVRAILEPEAGISRLGLADELYPGLDTSEQLKRLRQRLHDFQRRLPLEFGQVLIIGERELRFDLKECLVDAVQVLSLAEMRADDPQIPSAKLEAATAAGAMEFLPGWADLQQTVNEGRGAGDEYVHTLRMRLKAAHAALDMHKCNRS